MARGDRRWVSQSLYNHKGQLTTDLHLWWYPPEPQKSSVTAPDVEQYFLHRLFLWMPRRMWAIQLYCLKCARKELTTKGLYNRVRRVVDVSSYYYLAAEYLECRACKKTYISWSQEILHQLDPAHRLQFPAVLTYKGACDISVITLLRSRTLGNSPSLLHHSIHEMHSEAWLKQVLLYLADCQRHRKACETGMMQYVKTAGAPLTYDPPPAFAGIQNYRWLLACYGKDVLSRLEEVKAQVTSTYGSILKMDSTKKVRC